METWNVWNISKKRWTNITWTYGTQDEHAPLELTIDDAVVLCNRLNGNSNSSPIFEIRRVDNWMGGWEKRDALLTKEVAPNPSVAVNDHVCPNCRNDRCSKSEKSCWKCGGSL